MEDIIVHQKEIKHYKLMQNIMYNRKYCSGNEETFVVFNFLGIVAKHSE